MAVPWRVARSLDILLGQLNARAPNRNKASDGSIGDADHQNRNSDHNPWYPPPNGGIVTARDFTHDPARGLDCQWLANTLTAHRDPRIKYAIWNRQIWNPSAGWQRYSGANPHTSHLHLSVVASPACDSTARWAGIDLAGPPPPPPEDDMTPDEMLAAKMRFHDGRTVTMGTAVAETWQNAYDILALVRAFPALLAAATNDPDLTAEQIAQIVRDNQLDASAVAAQLVAPLQVELAKIDRVNEDDARQIAEATVNQLTANLITPPATT